MEKIKSVLGILGIISLCVGSFIIFANFTTVKSIMLDPDFLTTDKWSKGLIGTVLIFVGIGI